MILIDTHCHLNILVKEHFDAPLTPEQCITAQPFIAAAQKNNVAIIINVGTSIIESKNCIDLAQAFASVFATVGIHPTDATATWRDDIVQLTQWLQHKETYKIVGIGECGIDRYHPNYNFERQRDAFRAQIELSLEHNLALVVHSRDAQEETLRIVEEYRRDITRGIMHCYSYDLACAQEVINMGFVLGIGGTVTYPKNEILRAVVTQTDLNHIVLETDAPFLPPQAIRGKKNSPQEIKTIATFIAQLKQTTIDEVALKTTAQACRIFNINPTP